MPVIRMNFHGNGVLRCAVTHKGTAWKLVAVGELDLDTTDYFRLRVEEALHARPGSLHLDCSRVEFMDSVGIRALVVTAKICKERGVELAIDLSSKVGRLFHTLGINGSVLGAELSNPYSGDRTYA